MPHAPYVPAADRCFARIDKFDCECPHCGDVISSKMDEQRRTLPARLRGTSRRRAAAKLRPESPSVRDLVWNPHLQRLVCPKCHHVYVVGLLLYPAATGAWGPTDAPPDTVADARQHAELRRLAGGWHTQRARRKHEPVNLVVDQPCACPAKGWSAACPVHGGVLARAVPKEAKVDSEEESNGWGSLLIDGIGGKTSPSGR